MILQALYELYQRKVEIGTIAPDGFTEKEIDFLMVIDSKGVLVDCKRLKQMVGKYSVGQKYSVPVIGKQAEKHTNSGKDANLLWDKAEFSLGTGKKGDTKLASFIETIQEYYPVQPEDIKLLITFLKNIQKTKEQIINKVKDEKDRKELLSGVPVVSFIIEKDGNYEPIFYKSHVAEAILKKDKSVNIIKGTCLITGNRNVPIEEAHTVIKGIRGAKSSGANLVAFNLPASNSYGKEQGRNAPISKIAASGYTKALKSLVDSSDNKVRVADATIVFWSQKQSGKYDFEADFPWYFNTDKDDPDKGVKAVKNLYEAWQTGKLPLDEENRFYVLGLAPNAARLSVRFWKIGTIRDFAEKIKKHFDDLDIDKTDYQSPYCTIDELLAAVSIETNDINKTNRVYFKGKYYDVPPTLAGAFVVSIIEGAPYPITLLHQCVRRIRAEVSKKDKNGKLLMNVTRARAAILKAYINRFNRFYNKSEKEVFMSLDKSNTNVSYRMGRLFAVLEKIQEEANPGINATIRDRFYGAVSATPITVFPQLLKLKNHHLAKLNQGRKIYFEQQLGEIFDEIKADLPVHLTLNEQAHFAIGYYHQRQDLFKKK